ncbi:DEAD/DEAH box helicase [Litchfieldia alkalitelluris]|uniref:DEAD/DEAH box helicase n=1 Tax=Litchfieldia alkalitelluris TaxID=304268 RepID=UPI0009969171|nr:DEAD/DEAH box helicase [Litchfieldia alkalitelluris]
MRFCQKNSLLIPEMLLTDLSSQQLYPISYFPQLEHSTIYNPQFPFSKDLQTHLQGKQLLLDEIPYSIEMLQSHYEQGYISYRVGVSSGKSLTCYRCGNHQLQLFAAFDCARCKSRCWYCRKCIMMGRVSQCTPLISWIGPEKEIHRPEQILSWSGQLSEAQRVASDEVVTAVNSQQQILVWAVCGAGKTEVLFSGIETALAAGKRVCLATPRTDVVIELAPRIKAAFPGIDVIALYGGSEDRHKYAPITLATTHQLLRFYRAFDVIIIDEVDAFPYSSEPMLEYAVEQAKKEMSSTIYLSATPSKAWQKQVHQGKRQAIKIPARYHKHPLPIPTLKWCGNWQKLLRKKKIPTVVLHWLKSHLASKKQVFLFVPHIQEAEKYAMLLKQLNQRIEAVHSEDVQRKEKVAAFRRGEIPILITTTILERGVTVPNIDVAVLGAEDAIFTESALVQISGRVGRSADFPTGEILFYHYGKTASMIAAKKHIEQMNKEGRARNLLKG